MDDVYNVYLVHLGAVTSCRTARAFIGPHMIEQPDPRTTMDTHPARRAAPCDR